MAGSSTWVWDPTNEKWVPLRADADGSIHVVGYVDNLDDIGDVNVPTPTDDHVLYWDNAASKWQAKANWVAAHKTSHQNGGTDEIGVAGLSGLLADDQHVLDTEVKAIKLDDFTTPDDTTDLDASAALHGLMAKADKSKLDGIEAAATKYPDTGQQAFLDADHTKLDGIEAGADATPDANLTTKGMVELATAAETTTGTDATRAVTPDGLAGSKVAKRLFYIKVFDHDTAVATGDGKAHIAIPEELTGMNLVGAHAAVYTVSSSGLPTVQIHNLTDTSDMLSTVITIDENEKNSYTAATPPVINTGEDDVVTGDEIRIDVDVAGTGTKGLDVILSFQTP